MQCAEPHPLDERRERKVKSDAPVLATTCVRTTTLPLGSHDEALRGLELT
jgi:hypothetical protein